VAAKTLLTLAILVTVAWLIFGPGQATALTARITTNPGSVDVEF
jgi:hypothetical protein